MKYALEFLEAKRITSGRERWLVLTVATLTHVFVVAMPWAAIPVLINDISRDLNMSLVQIGTMWAAGSFASLLTYLPGGMVGDRFGVTRTLGVSCLLSSLALFLRGLSGNYLMFVMTTFFYSLVSALLPVNVHKTMGIYFPGRHLGLANGVVSLGMGLGATLGALLSATYLAPALGGWRNVLYLYAGISLAVTGLWWLTDRITSRNIAPRQDAQITSIMQGLRSVARSRNIWLFGLMAVGRSISVSGLVNYVTLYLERFRGWPTASAAGALTVINAVSMVTVLPLALLSDRTASRIAIVLPGLVVGIVANALFSFAGDPVLWLLLVCLGIFSDGYAAAFITMIQESEGIGPRHTGTALGLVFSMSNLASAIFSPVSYRLAEANPDNPFLFWAGMGMISLLAVPFLKGVWHSKKTGPQPIPR
jgi:MFS family permease